MNRLTKIVPALLCCWYASAPAWAIDCLSAPGDPKTGWYSWREIDGRKCWFKKTGAMPAKSQLHWTTTVEEKPQAVNAPPANSPVIEERTEPAPLPPSSAAAAKPVEAQPATTPQFRTVRVKPVPATSPRLGDNQVDLMNSGRLSAVQVFGAAPPKRGRPMQADPFDARFSGKGD